MLPLISVSVAMTRNWFETADMTTVTYSYYTVNLIGILIQCVQLAAPSIAYFKGKLEWVYYACSCIVSSRVARAINLDA